MSYILEALKKSQQERELGRVPTLDAGGVFDEDRVTPARGPWVPVAVVLATVAMFLALYAALRDPGSTSVAAPTPLTAAPRVAADPEVPPGRTGALTTGRGSAPQPPETLVSRDGAPPSQGLARPSPDLTPPSTTPQAPAIATPLIEPPVPKRPDRVRLQDPRETAGAWRGAGGEDRGRVGGLDAEEELELQRQIEAEGEWVGPDGADMGSAPTPVPRDLIADIESFKRGVRGGKGLEGSQVQPLRKSIDEAPERLRLTPSQEAELPAYAMTVHVYDRERDRRFVLINGLRYREGETTREGLRVERILAQGAVLSHKGNPFFVSR